MPNVVGQLQAAAVAALAAVPLAVGTITTVDSAAPAGEVLGQSPAAGASVVPNSPVDLQVSSGPVAVPAVVGQLQAAAVATLTAVPLVVGTITTVDSAAPAGEVLTQSPVAGASVAPNSPVDLQVSSGPVTVPDVVGPAQAAAVAA